MKGVIVRNNVRGRGGSQIKNVEYILGHLLEKAMDRGGIKSSLRINNKREREDTVFIYEGNK